jgi:hypothetical protein
MKRILFGLAIAGLLGGCVQPPVNYYYGRYSQSLYRSKKDGTPESLARHKKVLEDVIQKSTEKGWRVPPGIYCEYGYLLAKEGSAEADRYFSLEVQAYPESERFVSFLRTQVTKPKT